jgi:hypothetical protein
MHSIDQNIRETAREGPGSQRIVESTIKKGSFYIDEAKDLVIWFYNDSRIMISEPGSNVTEGKLIINTEKAGTEGKYNVRIYGNYSDIANITTPDGEINTIIGLNKLTVKNMGIYDGKIIIGISETKT